MRIFLILLLTVLFVNFTHAEDLLQTYEDAFKSNILKADLAKLYTAKGQKNQAMSSFLPHLGFNGSYAYYWSETLKHDWKENKTSDRKTQDGYDSFAIGIDISQVIFDTRAILGFISAQRGVEAAKFAYEDAEQTLILNSVKTYFSVLRAQDLLASLTSEEEAIKKQLDAVNQRYKSGLESITNLYQVQAAFDKVRSARISAETMVMSAYGDLRQITEKDYENLSILRENISLISPYPDDPEFWEKKSLEQNLSLKAAQKQVDSRNISKHPHVYPSLAFFFKYNFENNSRGSDLVAHNLVTGLRFSMDLYNGGKSYADAQTNAAQWLDAIANLEIGKRRVKYGAKTLFYKVKAGIVKVDATKQLVKSNKSALDSTNSSYRSGIVSVIDMLNAEKNLYTAEREYANARYDYIIDYLELKSLIGDLSKKDIEIFNSWLVAK